MKAIPTHCGRGPSASTRPVSVEAKARTETRLAVEMNSMISVNDTSECRGAVRGCSSYIYIYICELGGMNVERYITAICEFSLLT
jgi:hypothetical protein